MFMYTVCYDFDEDVFFKQCKELEKSIPLLQKGKLLFDVDSSMYQQYTLGDKTLTVGVSAAIKEVYIKSDFDVKPYLTK